MWNIWRRVWQLPGFLSLSSKSRPPCATLIRFAGHVGTGDGATFESNATANGALARPAAWSLWTSSTKIHQFVSYAPRWSESSEKSTKWRRISPDGGRRETVRPPSKERARLSATFFSRWGTYRINTKEILMIYRWVEERENAVMTSFDCKSKYTN